MNDPGLPPKPRSLHLLESLVNEEEARDRGNHPDGGDIYIPLTGTQSHSDPEYWEPDKQAVIAGCYSDSKSGANADKTDLEMKEANRQTKMAQDKPGAGPRSKKLRKPRSRSNSSERYIQGGKSKKSQRPFSADYNKNKREQINSKLTNGRAKSAKGGRGQQKAKGRRSRSPASYSSATYSSDEEYLKKEVNRKNSENSGGDKKKEPVHDAFFDLDKEPEIHNDSYSSDSSKSSTSASSYSSSFDSASDDDKHSNRRSSVQEKEAASKKYSRSASSSSSTGSDTDHRKRAVHKEKEGRTAGTKKYSRRDSSYSSSDSETDKRKAKSTSKYVDPGSREAKTVYIDKHGHQHSRKRMDSDNSNCQRMVVVDDYSTMSEDEKPEKRQQLVQQQPRLLSRKKKKRVTVVQQIQPDLYLEGKLQQKYSELEELMACSFVDPRSQVTRHHLYQMELLKDQYRTVSHGRPSSAVIIPRSLPGAMRNRGPGGGQRPGSARPPPQKHFYTEDGEHQSYDQAYGTIRSVMGAERARKHNKIRTDIHADRPSSAKTGKKKKKLEAKLKHTLSDSEEDLSEKPSMTSKGSSRSDGSTLTPRSGGPAIDHHIKYTENEKLKRWLKEKDKLYRKQVRQEKKKKRLEREKLINEANDKLEKKIESQKRVKEWMKEKNHELYLKHKEEKRKQKQEQGQNKETTTAGESTTQQRQLREDDVKVEEDKCRGEETPDYVKQQIRNKREIQEENRQAKLAQKGGPHPPQTKFIYKRPVAGKIKLNMQARAKSPTPKAAEYSETEEEKSEKMRLSYDDWVKKKREDDVVKRKNAAKLKQSEMAKSDPELNRMIPEIAQRRIEDKLNMRKKVNTGIKSYDEAANKSFGGGDFDGEEKPRNAYRLEGDSVAKQPKRPSTAPAARGRMPRPKQSSSSPRNAIIPQRGDKGNSTPHTLPFPPEKGVPAHVASRQQKLFDGKVAANLSESEQKELLQEVLVQEGVADVDETGTTADQQQQQNEQVTENLDDSKHADIETLMYSPKKKDSSDSSASDSEADKPGIEDDKDMRNTEESPANTGNSSTGLDQSPTHIDSFGTMEEEISQTGQDLKADAPSSNQYRTYSNLNDLQLESPNQGAGNASGGMDLGIDMEKLRERVEALSADSTGPPLIFSSDPRDSYESRSTDDDESHSETVEKKVITVISEDTDPNLVSILKESRKMDDIPIPEHSDELPEHRATEEASDSTHLNADESLTASRKRVSFNEQPEVFQSIDSSSTDTVTPDQGDDFDPEAESLDAQPYYVDEPEDGDNTPGNNAEGENESNDIDSVESDKLYFNIGGIELKPTVIPPDPDNVETEPQSTFITNPDSEV